MLKLNSLNDILFYIQYNSAQMDRKKGLIFFRKISLLLLQLSSLVLSQIVENKNVEYKMIENIWSKIIKSKWQKCRTDKNVENKKVEDWNVENGLSPYPLKLSLTKKTQILFFHFNSGYTVATFPLFNAENVSVNFTLFNADNVSVDFTYYCQRQGNFLRQKCKTSMNRFIVF